MSIWGKIFGGTSGYVVGGPLGGLLGIFAGHAIDKFSKKNYQRVLLLNKLILQLELLHCLQKWPRQMELFHIKN